MENVIDGSSRYELPLLASYPRSGTNWLRYFIETITNRPTPGQTRVVGGTNFVVDRAHRAYPVLHKYERVILILRDYKECLLRHKKDHWLATQDVGSFLGELKNRHPCFWYIENIKAFERFEKAKILIYYEDLIISPETEFRRLGIFLDFPDLAVSEFVSNLNEHIDRSVAAFTSGGHKSITTNNGGLHYHTTKLLTEDNVRRFNEYYSTKYSELTQKYLQRYQIQAE